MCQDSTSEGGKLIVPPRGCPNLGPGQSTTEQFRRYSSKLDLLGGSPLTSYICPEVYSSDLTNNNALTLASGYAATKVFILSCGSAPERYQ